MLLYMLCYCSPSNQTAWSELVPGLIGISGVTSNLNDLIVMNCINIKLIICSNVIQLFNF